MKRFNQQQEEKYLALLQSIPVEHLDTTSQKDGISRLKKQRIRRKRFIKSSFAVAVLMIALIGSIRISPAVASTLAQIPGLKPLVEMIALDKGMQDIINNDYYEAINKSQSIDGKTLTITGVVADESGMIISYKLDSNEDLANVNGVNVEVTQGKKDINEATVGASWSSQVKGTFSVEDKIEVAVKKGMDYSIKDFTVELSLYERPETVFKVPFTLKNDIKKSNHYVINKDVIIDGQRITIHKLIVSPLRTEFKLSIDPTNTKKILDFEDIRIYDEDGEIWGQIKNGFVGYGEYTDKSFSLLLESNYFRLPKNITIEFREIEAIDKADQYIVVDLEKKKVLSQPQNLDLKLLEVEDTFEIVYKIPPYKKQVQDGVLGDLIDANNKVFHPYSTWFSGHKDYLKIGQFYDVEYGASVPKSPVKIEIARYEQYLNGVGRINVQLNEISN